MAVFDALLESPIVAAAPGLLLVTLAAIYYSHKRTQSALGWLVLSLLVTAGCIAAERLIETPRERVLGAVGRLFAAIEANDLPAVLAAIDPAAARVRADAQALMPRFRVESAGEGGEVRVELAGDESATARLKPVIKVQHKQSGATGAYFDTLELQFVRRDGAWLLNDYTPAKDWREGAARLSR